MSTSSNIESIGIGLYKGPNSSTDNMAVVFFRENNDSTNIFARIHKYGNNSIGDRIAQVSKNNITVELTGSTMAKYVDSVDSKKDQKESSTNKRYLFYILPPKLQQAVIKAIGSSYRVNSGTDFIDKKLVHWVNLSM